MTCRTQGCEREHEREVRPSSIIAIRDGDDAEPRKFCEPCYQAWRSGARTTFTNGPPKGKKVEP